MMFDSANNFSETVVNVKAAQRLLLPDENVYKMTSSPRGNALIINNRTFTYEDDREGSERDYNNLIELCKGLGYNVRHYEDQEGQDIKRLVSEFAKLQEHNDVDSCVVAISSHGLINDVILGTDSLHVDVNKQILTPFNNTNCPALMYKPKMFFFQACRGTQVDEGVQVDSSSFPPVNQSNLPTVSRRPSWSDMLIVQSTIPGYVANRHKYRGSWFVQSIVETFMERACDTDMETMLKMVSKSVSSTKTKQLEMQAPEVTLRGWTKSLYFNPGL